MFKKINFTVFNRLRNMEDYTLLDCSLLPSLFGSFLLFVF